MAFYRVPFLAGAGVQTDDGRTFTEVTWRNLPLPLAFQTDTQHANLATSEIVGQIVDLGRDTDGSVWALLEVDPRDANGRAIHPEGARAARMIEQGGQGISIDGLVPIDATITDECVSESDEDGMCLSWAVTFSEVIIGGATLTPIPAFSRAIVDPAQVDATGAPLEAEDPIPLAMVASAAASEVPALVARSGFALTAAAAVDLSAWAPDPAHFAEPELSVDGPSITVTEDGRIFGWLAYFDVCHASFPQACVLANDQSRDLSRFLRNPLPVGDTEVPVGFLTMDTGHASTRAASMDAVLAHYDDTRAIAAIVTAGVRDEGIWFSGSLRPTLDAWQRAVLAAGSVSGDWRADRGESERTLRAALVVPVPGFPKPALAASAVLVAAGSPTGCGCGGGGECGCSAQPAPLTAAQRAALARLADERLRTELAEVDGVMLDLLPEALAPHLP